MQSLFYLDNTEVELEIKHQLEIVKQVTIVQVVIQLQHQLLLVQQVNIDQLVLL